jgi:GT2 family glycosyltransferase
MLPFDLRASVSVVIPNWNGEDFLAALLGDLRDQSLPPTGVVMVDNGSTDTSVAVATAAGATVERLPYNHGFAAAVNYGVRATQSELVAILNNDLRLEPDWLLRITNGLGPQHAFATGKILSASRPGTIDGTWDEISKAGMAWRCGAGRPDDRIWSEPAEIRISSFTAILIRRDVFLDVGGLDESFESYLEDVDFGLRSASLGHKGIYVPAAVSYHFGSGTLGRWHPRVVRRIARNQVRLVAKNYPSRVLLRYGWKIAMGQLLWGFVAARHGAAWPWVMGKMEGLRTVGTHARAPLKNLEAIVEESEARMRALQQATGRDTYWRLYFALT